MITPTGTTTPRLTRADILPILLDYPVEPAPDRVGKAMDANSCRYTENSTKRTTFMRIIDRVAPREGTDAPHPRTNVLMTTPIKSRRRM